MNHIFCFGHFFLSFSLLHAQSPISEFDDSDGPLKKGIIFHEDRKILMAEKFINVQFLLPFPKFSVSLKSELDLLRTMKHEIRYLPTTSAQSLEALRTIAETIALKMIELKQPFQERLAQTSTLKMTFCIGLGSFIISMLLHLFLCTCFTATINSINSCPLLIL